VALAINVNEGVVAVAFESGASTDRLTAVAFVALTSVLLSAAAVPIFNSKRVKSIPITTRNRVLDWEDLFSIGVLSFRIKFSIYAISRTYPSIVCTFKDVIEKPVHDKNTQSGLPLNLMSI